MGGNRRLDAAIAGVLEMMKLRYTGAGPEGMHLARDKALAKAIVADLGVDGARRMSSSTAAATAAARSPSRSS